MTSPFEKYLNEDEHILWQGQPKKYVFSVTFIITNTLTNLLGIISMTVMTFVAYIYKAPIIFKIFGLTFLSLSIFFMFFIYFLHAFRRSRTCYAITEQRIFIAYWFLRKRIKSYQIKSLPEPIFKKQSNDIATILINYEKPWSYRIFTLYIEYSWRDQFRRFEYISNAQKVFELLNERRTKTK